MGFVLAANLGHDHHQSHGSDVSTLPAHVASCDDLKACLLRRIYIVGHKFGLHDFLLNGMSTLLDSQRVCELWFSYWRSAKMSHDRNT
jgi:hypothetical protein